jgi:peptide/nickel transport system substrate-binding protein
MALLVFGAAGCGGDDDEEGGEAAQTGGTLVFAGAADPVVIDGALVSDGESIRVITQIFETLINLKPGTTELAPGLATDWEVSPDALTYTFALREGVKFHDGTDFNAEAVCFNFDRWYNFKGPLQSPSASYYYSAFFGGFKKNESEDLSDPLYKSCEARNPTTAVITLTRPSASLLGALVQQAFSIASPKALGEFKADAGTVDEETGFRPTGTFGTEHPIGTGPFKFVEFKMNEGIKLAKNPDYWKKGRPYLDGIEFTIMPDRGTRMLAFIAGKFDMTFPTEVTIPLLKDIKSQAPDAVCEVAPMKNSIGMLNSVLARDARAAGLASAAACGSASPPCATRSAEPMILFCAGQITPHTLSSMMVPSHAPTPMITSYPWRASVVMFGT